MERQRGGRTAFVFLLAVAVLTVFTLVDVGALHPALERFTSTFWTAVFWVLVVVVLVALVWASVPRQST